MNTGAIHRVSLGASGAMECSVLGDAEPRGICGSGLVDAAAAGLDAGRILPGGRLAGDEPLGLCGPVILSQNDIRELQLAKAAIAAGARLLLERLGAEPNQSWTESIRSSKRVHSRCDARGYREPGENDH